MQIVRFPRLNHVKGLQSLAFLSLVSDRWVTANEGGDLYLYDLHALDTPVVIISNVIGYTLHPTCLVALNSNGEVLRWDYVGDIWQETVVWHNVNYREDKNSFHLILSTSMKFLISGNCVFNAYTGELLHSNIIGFCAFGISPFGREIIFCHAAHLYGIKMLDAHTGKVLKQDYIPNEEGFIHTDFILSADGTRLITDGCYWAGSYGIHIYDCTAWMSQSSVNQPLPLLLGEECNWQEMLPISINAQTQNTYTIYILAALGEVAVNLQAAINMNEALPFPHDFAIHQQLYQYSHEGYSMAILAITIDLLTGTIQHTSMAPIPITREVGRIHQLKGNKILLMNTRIQVFNPMTGELHDLGPFDAPSGYFISQVTSDANQIIIWE